MTPTWPSSKSVVAKCVLRLFERRTLLAPGAACDMASWGHNSGFSLDASVRIEARDRAGLERLLRYCARPAFARQRLTWRDNAQQLIYRLSKLDLDGRTVLVLTPIERLNRLAVLITPPRRHRHRYFGVLAPNARLRALVTAYAGLPLPGELDPHNAPVGNDGRGVHIQGLMDSPLMVEVDVASENPAQVPLVEDEHIIQALAA